MKKTIFFLSLCVMSVVMCAGLASCGSDNNDGGGTPAGGQLVGLWYEHDGDYIHGYFFNADGNGWKGEWRVGSQEEHRAFTWKVEGNRLSTYSPNGGDQMDDFVYSISADGKTLTLTSPRSGSVKGVFQRQ